MAILFDGPVEPDALTTFIRNVPVPDQFGLTSLFPTVTRDDNQVDFAEIVRTNRTARYRSFDGRIHVSARDTGSEKRVNLIPLSTSLSKGEYERLQLEFARTGGTNKQRLVASVYNDAQNLTREVQARIEQAWGDVLTDGKLTINEDGFQGEADYGVPASQIVSAGTSWTTIASATPLTDLVTWTDTYFTNNGVRPGRVLMSLTTQRLLQTNAQLINAIKGSAMGATRVTIPEINDLFASEGLPLISQPYGTLVDIDGTSTLVLAANKVILMPDNPADLGALMMGISATALELVNSNVADFSFEEAPGIVGVIEKDGPPYREWVYVDAVGMPVLTTARLLMVATV